MSDKGLLINYQFCSGCHACEVACKKELGLPQGQFGIKVFQLGPWSYGDGKWEYDFVPVLSDMCDLCQERVAADKWPSCVHNCQAMCIEYGTVEELVKKADALTGKYSLYVPNK